jgi:tetratricopeptide (TPR) repeat protein
LADGVFEGFLGGEDEAAEESELAAAAGAEAIAIAHAMDEARTDPEIARQTSEFLRQQSRLVALQSARFEEEQALRLAHMRHQSTEGHLRRIGQRIRLGILGLLAAAVGLIALGVVIMLAEALASHSVVVDAFQAPSALAGRGLTGDVVAAGVLDTLQKLQDAARAASKGLETRSAWSSDIKIEVPETGVSIGEVDRLLHARLGHDVHIGGDLLETANGGLVLTVRGDGVPAQSFSGGPGDLDKLTAEAAEYAFGRAEPYQYATYLFDTGRYADALAFIPGAYTRAPARLRADLANEWGNVYSSLNDGAKAAAKHRLALSLRPRFWNAWNNLVADLALISEEASWKEGRAMMRAVAAAPPGDRPDASYESNWAVASQDWPLALASLLADAAHNNGAGASGTIDGPVIADDYAYLHDPADAEQYLIASDPDDPTTKAEALLLPGYAALERGDAASAIAPLEAFWKAWLADTNLRYSDNEQPCRLALAYGLTNRMADADAVFKRAGRWAYCYAVHGDVLEHAGDLAGAERIWAEGLRIGPDLSPVYLHRGISETKRGALKAALADLAAANARSPHWADPLKAWGDALMRAGNRNAALAKYDEALQYAPAWAALHRARDAAK